MSDESKGIYEVVWPSGKRTIKEQPLAKRLDTLNGKTVAELWSHTFKGDVMFRGFEDELKERYPDVKFISWEEFGEIHGAHEREVLAALPEKLKKFGCDCAITGVGGGASGAAADVRTSILVEKLGIPTVTIMTEAFTSQGKQMVKQHFYEHARVSLRQLGTAAITRFYEGIEKGNWPEQIGTTKDLDRKVQMVFGPDAFQLLVSGDPGRDHVLICAQNGFMGYPVSEKIEFPEITADETLSTIDS